MGLSLGFLLRADTEQAESAIRKLEGASERTASAVEGNFARASSGIASSIAGIAPAVGIATAAVTAFAGTVVGLAVHAAEYGESIYEASLKTGFSTKQLSALAAASKQTGESFESLVTALARMQRNIGEALVNQMAVGSKALLAAAGGAEKLKKASEDGGEGLQRLVKRIVELREPSERNLALQALLGRGWQQNRETLQLLAEEGFGGLIAKAKQWNMLVTTEQAAADHTFVENINTIKAQTESLALSVGTYLIPKLLLLQATIKAGVIPQLEGWYYRLKAVALAGMHDYAGAAEASLRADDKWRESITGVADELIKQDNAIRSAIATMNKAAGAADGLGLGLDKVVKKDEELIKLQKEENELTHLGAVRFGELTAELVKIESHYVTALESAKNYIFFVKSSLADQAKTMEEHRKQAQQPVEEPEGIGGLSPEQMDRIQKANDAIVQGQKQNKLFTEEAARAWQQYYQALSQAQNPFDKLNMAIQAIINAHRQGLPIIIAFGKALQEEGKAAEEAAKKAIQSEVASLLSHIVSRRAYAIIEASVETARGFAALASYQYWSAAMHFISAADWAVVAGKSGGGGGRGAGGGGESAEQRAVGGESGSPGVAGGGGGRTVGSGGTQHQTIVNIYGGAITDTHNLANLTAAINSGGNTGTVKINASGSAYTIPAPVY